MFENTLLIIKPDFMSRRKCLLLHLLSKGFQIQGNRKLAFTPEDAGEFYRDSADDKCYMLYVIMLAKGTSEAFILRKMNAAEELVHTLICFFGTSMEMDRNVHVSHSVSQARREITFIFPNYIHEPIEYFDSHRFSQLPVIGPLLNQAFDIVKKPSENQHENWRLELSDWLLKKNAIIPEISNQCSRSPQLAIQEKAQQTDITTLTDGKDLDDRLSLGTVSTLPGATSDLMSSTSCVSCGSFRSVQPMSEKADIQEFEKRLEMRAKKTLEEECICLKEPAPIVCEEHTEWVHIYEDGSTIESIEKVAAEEEVPVPKEELVLPESSNQSLDVQQEPDQEEVFDEVPIVELSEDRPPAEGEVIVLEVKAEEPEKKDEGEEGLKIESAAEPAEGPILESEPEPAPVEQPTEAAEPPPQEEEAETAPAEEEAPPAE